MTQPGWLRQDGDAVVVSIHAQPGAARCEIVGEHGGALKVKLAAPPVDGRANAALIEFVAGRLGIARSRVVLAGGNTSRQKRLRIEGVDCDSVEAALARAKQPTPHRRPNRDES